MCCCVMQHNILSECEWVKRVWRKKMVVWSGHSQRKHVRLNWTRPYNTTYNILASFHFTSSENSRVKWLRLQIIKKNSHCPYAFHVSVQVQTQTILKRPRPLHHKYGQRHSYPSTLLSSLTSYRNVDFHSVPTFCIHFFNPLTLLIVMPPVVFLFICLKVRFAWWCGERKKCI